MTEKRIERGIQLIELRKTQLNEDIDEDLEDKLFQVICKLRHVNMMYPRYILDVKTSDNRSLFILKGVLEYILGYPYLPLKKGEIIPILHELGKDVSFIHSHILNKNGVHYSITECNRLIKEYQEKKEMEEFKVE